MDMIFGTRAQPRVMSFKLSDDFRKMDPCKGNVQIGTVWEKRNEFEIHLSIPTLDSVWCSPAGFLFQKKQVSGVLQPKTVFLAFYRDNM